MNGKWSDGIRTIRRVSSLWSVNTSFTEVMDHKTGLPSCNTISGGTLRVPDSPRSIDGRPDDLIRRSVCLLCYVI